MINKINRIKRTARRKLRNLTASMWLDGDIPARIFFKILDTNKVALLIKDTPGNELRKLPTNAEILAAWEIIFDEFFELKKDRKLKLIMETKKEILQIFRNIEHAKPVLYALATSPFNEEQLEELVGKLSQLGITIDLTKSLTEEVANALKVQIAGMETALKIEEDNLKTLTQGQKQTFEQNCVKFEEFGYNTHREDSLRMYVAREKAVINQSKKNKNTKDE